MKRVCWNGEQLRDFAAMLMNLTVHRAVVVELKPYTRSKTRDQENKFHAMCRDLARSGTEFHGRTRSAEEWKAIMKSAVMTARRKEQPELVIGIEGEIVELTTSCARWNRKDYTEAITYMEAWGAEHGIRWADDTEWYGTGGEGAPGDSGAAASGEAEWEGREGHGG